MRSHRRLPPRADAASIELHARDYLTRWFTSRAHLRRLLLRRVDRSLEAHGGDRAALARAADVVLDTLVAEGALNDALYARDKTRVLLRRGVSEAGVRQRLAARGLGGEHFRSALGAVRESGVDPAMSAACAYVRRRRFGAYRIDEEARALARSRDLAAMGRAGFSYGVACTVLGLTLEEVEDRLPT